MYTARYYSGGVFCAHKPRQIACVGFLCSGRVRLRVFCLQDTGRKKSSRSPCCSKVLLRHDFADGIFHVIFGKIHLNSCRVDNIYRAVLVGVGSMEIDAF